MQRDQTRSSPAARAFRDIPQQANGEIASEGLFDSGYWPGVLDWDELLKSQRILIVGEAGVGKTFESRAQAQRLTVAGQQAFFVEAHCSTRELSSRRDRFRLTEIPSKKTCPF